MVRLSDENVFILNRQMNNFVQKMKRNKCDILCVPTVKERKVTLGLSRLINAEIPPKYDTLDLLFDIKCNKKELIVISQSNTLWDIFCPDLLMVPVLHEVIMEKEPLTMVKKSTFPLRIFLEDLCFLDQLGVPRCFKQGQSDINLLNDQLTLLSINGPTGSTIQRPLFTIPPPPIVSSAQPRFTTFVPPGNRFNIPPTSRRQSNNGSQRSFSASSGSSRRYEIDGHSNPIDDLLERAERRRRARLANRTYESLNIPTTSSGVEVTPTFSSNLPAATSSPREPTVSLIQAGQDDLGQLPEERIQIRAESLIEEMSDLIQRNSTLSSPTIVNMMARLRNMGEGMENNRGDGRDNDMNQAEQLDQQRQDGPAFNTRARVNQPRESPQHD